MASRTQNTKRNIIFSYIFFAIQFVFGFASRSLIINFLGTEYLGLSSLFSSILQVLSVAELGFSGSVVFFLYKPLAEGNTDKVCSLLNFLKRVYRIVGSVILGAGLCVTPFLSFLINGEVPPDINIYILYILYLINTSVSYFLFSYKSALLSALQRLDLTKVAHSVVILIQYVLQIVAIVVFRNFYLLVVSTILGTALINVISAIICTKKFPEYKAVGDIDKETKADIAKKVRGLLICNISGVTYTAFDSIIISAFVGLDSVTKYSNYMAIYSSVVTLIVMIRTSMQASVGDSIAVETKEKNLNDMYLWQFIFSVIATFCGTCLISLYQPFMKLWMGDEMLLPMRDAALISAWFVIGIVQHAYYLYLTGAGIWNEVKGSYIFSTISNFVLNIVLGKFFGITGIVIASLVACFVSGSIWQCVVLFKVYYKTSAKKYLTYQFAYFAVAAFIMTVSCFLCSIINIDGILGLFVKACVCVAFAFASLLLVYIKNPHFKSAKMLFFRIINRQKS